MDSALKQPLELLYAGFVAFRAAGTGGESQDRRLRLRASNSNRDRLKVHFDLLMLQYRDESNKTSATKQTTQNFIIAQYTQTMWLQLACGGRTPCVLGLLLRSNF